MNNILAWLMIAVAVLTPAAARAQIEQSFDIPAQPLAHAVATLSRTAKIGIAFEADDLAGKRSSPVKGHITPQLALQLLLENTELAAQFVGPDSAIIFDPRSPEAAARASAMSLPTERPSMMLDLATVRAPRTIGRPDPHRYDQYARQAQDRIQGMFASDPAFRDADFTFRIAISLDGQGQITKVQVLRPSDTPLRDRLVIPLILGRTITPPPPDGLVQPLTFDIVGRLPVRPARVKP